MARFDVYLTRDGEQYLLDCQSDWLNHFDTRFVVPLVTDKPVKEASRLHPVLDIRGKPMIMATHLASAVEVNELGPKISNVSAQHISIVDALDMLTGGY